MPTTPKRPSASAAGTEARLHAAAVQAGAGAAIQAVLHSLPLLRPFVPARLLAAADGMQPDRVRRELVKTIYQRHGLKPARWETESVLAVAETQARMSPLTRKDALRDLLGAWLPKPLVTPLLRYTAVEPLVEQTTRAVATTWAAGRYADAVCRVRKAGMDWLPAPLNEALDIAPAKLRDFSAEALTLALPPLKLAAAWGGQVLRASGRIARAAGEAAGRPAAATHSSGGVPGIRQAVRTSKATDTPAPEKKTRRNASPRRSTTRPKSSR